MADTTGAYRFCGPGVSGQWLVHPSEQGVEQRGPCSKAEAWRDLILYL